MSTTNEDVNEQLPVGQQVLSKVPQVTIYFWIIKILTTGMGEAASDFLVLNFFVVALALVALGFVVALVIQFRVRRYIPGVYWSAIVMVSIFGTMAADVPHALGMPLWSTSTLYLVALVAVFALWYARERTLSFSAIDTRRREGFYWAAVLATFALGTAVGDLTAFGWHLGLLASGFLFMAMILVPAVAGRFFGLNSVAAFWFAYVLTRPLGASFADWMSAPTAEGGLGLGTGLVTVLWTIPIVGLIGYLAVSGADTKRQQPLPS